MLGLCSKSATPRDDREGTQRKRNAIWIGKHSEAESGITAEPTQKRKKSEMLRLVVSGTWDPVTPRGLGRLRQLKSTYRGINDFPYTGQFSNPTKKKKNKRNKQKVVMFSSATCPVCYHWPSFLQLPRKDLNKVLLPLQYKLELLCLLPKPHRINFLPYLFRNPSSNKVCYFPWLIFGALDLHNAAPALFVFSG